MLMLVYAVPSKMENQRLQVFLRQNGITAGLIKAVKHQGRGFFADGQPIHTDQPVHAGQKISFSLPPEQSTQVCPQEVPFAVVYEDDFVAVLEKTAGIAVHPTLNYPDHTLANGWIYHLRQRGENGIFRPVNRIDKNTSGLVLCAKNSFAAPLLAHHVQKCYLAVAEGRLTPEKPQEYWQEIDRPIGRRGDSIIGRCVAPDGKPSITKFHILSASDEATLLACLPLTGRTHQIRVHMAWLGHPLCGDDLYGGSTAQISRHALHCAAMLFRHPYTGQIITAGSDFPQDMTALCQKTGINCQNLQEKIADFFAEAIRIKPIREGEPIVHSGKR